MKNSYVLYKRIYKQSVKCVYIFMIKYQNLQAQPPHERTTEL